jgi:hypothetical protein
MRKFFLVNLQSMQFKDLANLITQGAQSTHECFTPEYLAGQYAYWEASGRDSLNDRTFKDELKLLKHIGAVFVTEQALEEANKFKQALTDDTVSFARLRLKKALFNRGDHVVSLIETYRPKVERVIAIDNRENIQRILCETGHGDLWRCGADYRLARQDEQAVGYRLHPEKLNMIPNLSKQGR